MKFVYTLQVDSICLREKKIQILFNGTNEKNVILQAHLKSRNLLDRNMISFIIYLNWIEYILIDFNFFDFFGRLKTECTCSWFKYLADSAILRNMIPDF